MIHKWKCSTIKSIKDNSFSFPHLRLCTIKIYGPHEIASLEVCFILFFFHSWQNFVFFRKYHIGTYNEPKKGNNVINPQSIHISFFSYISLTFFYNCKPRTWKTCVTHVTVFSSIYYTCQLIGGMLNIIIVILYLGGFHPQSGYSNIVSS